MQEKWYESRRIWGAGLSVLVVIGVAFAPDQYDLIMAAGAAVAAGLGITSWVKPKK